MNLRTARSRGSAWLAGVFTLLATSGGCSLFYDLNTTQCEVTSDCIALGPQFAETTCSNKVCVPMSSSGGMTSAGGKSGSTGGSSNTNGGMANLGGGESGGTSAIEGGAGGEAGGPPQAECATNGDCIDAHVDQPYVCMDGSCVAVTNEDCPVLIPSAGTLDMLKKSAPILLGGFASMTNDMDLHDTQAIINWDLAFSEFNSTLPGGGLPAQGGGRPILGLMCQGKTTDEGISRALDHLAQLRVPAVVSTLSTDLLYNAYQYTQDPEKNYRAITKNSMFFMSTGSADLRLANMKDNGLVWHMLGDPRVLAATTVSLVQRIEPYVNAQRQAYFDANPTTAEDPSLVPLRVTLVYSDDLTMSDISSVLTTDDGHSETLLTFNGKSALDAANDGNFRQVKIESIKGHSTPNVADGITELQTHPPHLIVAMATSEFPKTVVPAIENNWGTTSAPASVGVPRPFYLMSHFIYNTSDLQTTVKNAGQTPLLSDRIVGVNYAIAQDAHSQSLYNTYLGHLQASYQGKLSLGGTENYYDGAYSLLYSLAAAAAVKTNVSDPIIGTDIGLGLTDRVFSVAEDAVSVDIGPKQIAATVSNLNSSLTYSMSMWGCMGAPNFNRTSGTRVSATSAWCISPGAKPTDLPVYHPDGLLYDSNARMFSAPTSGAPACLAKY